MGRKMNLIRIARSYTKTTLYIYLIFYFFLFCWIVKSGYDEIITNGEGIYKTIVSSITAFLFMPVFFVLPIVASFIFSHILYERKRKNLFMAWILSFTVVPTSITGAFFVSFELLYLFLILLLLLIVGVSLFYSRAKLVISILLIYILYLLELYLAEVFIHA